LFTTRIEKGRRGEEKSKGKRQIAKGKMKTSIFVATKSHWRGSIASLIAENRG
jgi:hypothetical protein